MKRGPVLQRGLQGEEVEEGARKKLGEVRERRTQESTHARLTATAEKKKGNNRQEGRGGRSLE